MTDLVLNKNFYNYIGVILFAGYAGSGAAQIGTAYVQGEGYMNGVRFPSSFVDTDGNSFNGLTFVAGSGGSIGYSWRHSLFVFNVPEDTSHANIKFICGSGSTAATVNDTSLVTPNSNITATIETGKRDTYNSMIFTVTFSAATEQTLREIGIIRNLHCVNDDYTTLLGRAVLDEPVTLDAEHSLTLQIRLSLPIPA